MIIHTIRNYFQLYVLSCLGLGREFYNHDTTSIVSKIPFPTPNMIIHIVGNNF